MVRTGGTTSYFFEIPDPHGSSSLYLDNTAQSPTWRQFTPYGAPRGTSQAWIDNRGFLNKPADASTGLTYVGARAYDPLTSQFISPDPVLVPNDPLDLNAYAYGMGNPIGNSDPTGLSADPSECQLHQQHDGNGFSGSGSSTSSINTTSTGTANTGHSGSTSGGNSWQKTVQWAIRLARSNPCVIDPLLCMGSNSNPIRINAGFLNTSGTAQIPITSCLLLGEMPVCANMAASGGGKSGGGSSGDGSGGAGAVSLITRVLELARALGQGALTGEQAAAQLAREFSGERHRAIADVRNYYRGTVDSMRATEGAMREAGATDEAVARQLVPMRNAAKVAARDLMNPDEVRELEAYNMGRYNNPVGPDADYLFNKYGSWQQVIDAAYRPDPAINAIADALEASWGGGGPPA